MKLIGMLDSPYVRRTAISLRYLRIDFEHIALSVFNDFAEFQTINPVVKAPSLIDDEGQVLMDSTLIMDLAERLASPGLSLMPEPIMERRSVLIVIGLSLAACEKAVQYIYEKRLRPADKYHYPWLDRVSQQLLAACAALETEVGQKQWDFSAAKVNQAGITAAVTWQFIQSMVGDLVIAAQYPALAALSVQAEAMPEFLAFPPTGPGVNAGS